MIKKCFYHLVFLLLCTFSVYGQETIKRRFLFKSIFDTTRHLFGSHIEMKEVVPESDDFIKLDIEDCDKISRSGYTRADYIQILGEYLTFEGDTGKSNRRFPFKPAYYSTLPEDTVGYTIQVEALYSFTGLLTRAYPPIRPTIVDRKTGEHLNTKLSVLRELYDL